MSKHERALEKDTILAGKYIVLDVLGEGGFGITYLCKDLNVGVNLAIKEYFPIQLSMRQGISVMVYTDALEHYQKGLEGFVREAEILAQYNTYKGIVSVNEFFYENNTAYIVMEYIEGIDLKQYLAQNGGTIAWKDAVNMISEILPTLHLIHKHGIIHRDISPDNIMVTPDGHIKLVDFGAARAVNPDTQKSLTVMLKHGYAPIEQYVSNGMQGPWTDVYSLCATLFKMITGNVPKAATDRQQGSKKIFTDEINCPGKLKNVLYKGMTVDPKTRYQTVEDLQKALEDTLRSKGTVPVLAAVAVAVAIVGVIAGVSILNLNKSKESSEYVSKSNERNEINPEEESVDEYVREYRQIEEAELVSEIEELTGCYVYHSYYDDFDGDGIKEMFALALSRNIPLESMETNESVITCSDSSLVDHTAVLCFANEDGAQAVSEVISIQDTSLRIDELIFGEGKCIFWERNGLTDYDRNIYAFYSGEIFQNDVTYLDVFGTMNAFEYKNQDGMLYVKSDYSLQVDENYREKYIRITPGAETVYYSDWIPYIYHGGQIYEQELREVPQEDFLRYDNASDILESILTPESAINIVTSYNGHQTSINDCILYNILYDGSIHYYINYVYKDPYVTFDSQPACNAEVVLLDGELSLDRIESGMKFSKYGFLPGCYLGEDGEIEYSEQTEEEYYITQLLKESNLYIIDYCYDDFNVDGNYEMLGILSDTPGTNEGYSYSDRIYFQAPIEIWQVNERGCVKTDIEMQESYIDTYYCGFEILQFGETRQIEILDQTVARTGLSFTGIVAAIDENGNFYTSLTPLYSLSAIDGISYYSLGTEIIDTPYYGVGYDASLYYPIYYIDGKYYEMASVEIETSILDGIDNWSQIESEINDLLNSDYSWPNCWRGYGCADAEITNVLYNEVGKIYINYCGTEYLPNAAMMDLDIYPDSYATAELTLKGNHIESFELLAGIRETYATGFEIMQSDVSKLFQ